MLQCFQANKATTELATNIRRFQRRLIATIKTITAIETIAKIETIATIETIAIIEAIGAIEAMIQQKLQ